MLEALSKRRNDDRGFTLIELMIVVLIIGILLAVGFPTFLGAQRRAQNRASQALLATALTAAKVWYTDESKYGTGFTVAAAEAIEPSIDFDGTAVKAAAAQGVVGLSDVSDSTVVLSTKSGSGVIFCVKDVSGTLTYGNSTISANDCSDASKVGVATQAAGWKTP